MFHIQPSLVYGGCLLLLVVLSVHVYKVLNRPLSRVPGPRISRWSDAVTRYYWLTGRRGYYVHALHEKYGPIVRVGPEEIDISEVAAVRDMYSIKGDYQKDPKFYSKVVPPGIVSVFSTWDVEVHRRHRRLLSGALSESSLKIVAPIVRSRAVLMVDKLAEELVQTGVMDIFKWSIFYTTDVIGELSFGESFRMLEIGQKIQYIEDLERISPVISIRTGLPELMFLARYLPLPFFAKAVAVGKRMRGYSTESIQRYKHRLAVDPNACPTLFTKLCDAGKDGMTDNEIVSNAQTYIVAGSDTTAITLTYLVWNVARRPDIRAALVKELAALPDDFTAEHLKELPYLNQVAEETLRLYPAISVGLPRVVPPDGRNISGYWVPGGATVSAQAYTMNRDAEIFPNPEVFDPSRWEHPTKAMKDAFVTFGGGSRVCIGMHLARMELRLGAALFLRRFPNVRPSDKDGMCDDDMVMMTRFVSQPKGKRCLVEA